VLALLPTPLATLVHGAHGGVALYGPHSGVWLVPPPCLAVDVPPDVVKILFGRVAHFVDRMLGEAEHPFLAVFAEAPSRGAWAELLREAEESVTITPDQIAIRRWLANPVAITRRTERLCQRYAGQPPQQILKQLRFSAEFAANLPLPAYQPLGHFADQSHYIRACRELTGYTPTALRNLSRSFYLHGEVLPRLAA
jgi:hypothetical protein